jgi:hypothetical protein
LEEDELMPEAKRQVIREIEKLRSRQGHFWYEHFPNKGLAKKFLREQKKTGKWGDLSYSKKAIPIGDRGTADQKVLEEVHAKLALSDLDANAKAQVKRMVDQIYSESLEETNARQGRERRKGYGIAGAERNMLRSFVVNASSEANLLANLKHGKAITMALSTVRKNATEIDRREDTPDGEMIRVYNMLAQHYNIRLRKKHHPIVDSVASFITAWLLTSSLSYHLQNGTQTIAVAVPIIAADFKSYTRVMNQLPKSYKIAHKVISYDKKIPFVGSKRATWTLNIDLEALPEEDKWAIPLLSELDGMELLDLGIEQDLKDTHTGDTGFTSVDKGMQAAGTISHRLYQVPRGVEAYNRISTALTAYKLALDKPSRMRALGYRGADKGANALDYAIKKTQDTQGDFTSDGAPYAMKWVMENVPAGKLAIQYKKFPLLMAWNFSRSVHMAFKGATREERAIGFRATRNLVAHTVLFSGIRGLPFMTSVYAGTLFYMTLFGDEDDKEEIPNDPVVTDGAFERAIIKAFPDNPKLAEAIYRGPFAAFANIDTSMKLSHGKSFSILPFTKFEISEEGFKDIGVGLLGPTGNVSMNMARAGEFFRNGNVYRGVENMMPKGLRDPMEAIRFYLEGYTTKGGDVLAPPTDFKELSLMLKALGIPPRDIVKLKWTRSEQYQIEQFYIDEQSKLRKRYIKAYEANNNKELGKIFSEWDALQDGKDRVRGFFNNAPSKIPRTDISSLLDMPSKKFRRGEDYQEALKTGNWKTEEGATYSGKFN